MLCMLVSLTVLTFGLSFSIANMSMNEIYIRSRENLKAGLVCRHSIIMAPLLSRSSSFCTQFFVQITREAVNNTVDKLNYFKHKK